MPERDQRERTDADPVVDLRTPSQRPIGEPGECPACGGPGYLDMINLRGEVQVEHCKACGHKWTTPFAELAPRGV
jgi:Zn ribbon nucleic-acid-binding protein